MSMMKYVLAALAGGAAGAALTLAVLSKQSSASGGPTTAEVESIVRRDEGPLQGRLDQLQREVEQLRTPPEAARIDAQSTPKIDLDPLTTRIAALEARVDGLMTPKSDQQASGPNAQDATRHAVEGALRTVMNRSASDDERIDAFGKLRQLRTEDGQDARSHEAVLAMLDIAENSNDEKTRYKVYINLHGASDAAARDGMLRALANDSSPKVREKVAGDLDSLVSDPLVESALRMAADGDRDAAVRARASKTLSEKTK